MIPRFLLFVASLFFVTGCSFSRINTGRLNHTAIKGYDPVAYFTMHKPVKGSPSFTTEWQGATWYFAKPENQMLFVQRPDKYAPQYGGYCAWAVAHNSTADIDPEAWKIVNGKLYLNYNKDIQSQWEEDQKANIEQADKNWPGLAGK